MNAALLSGSCLSYYYNLITGESGDRGLEGQYALRPQMYSVLNNAII